MDDGAQCHVRWWWPFVLSHFNTRYALTCRYFPWGNDDVFVCLSLTPYLCPCSPEKVCSSGWAKRKDWFPFWWGSSTHTPNSFVNDWMKNIYEETTISRNISYGSVLTINTTSRKRTWPGCKSISVLIDISIGNLHSLLPWMNSLKVHANLNPPRPCKFARKTSWSMDTVSLWFFRKSP
jgi:hypothetical protein